MLSHVVATRYVTPLREGGSLPGLMEADDLGTQNSQLISPEMYRRILKLRHKAIFSVIKKKAPHVKVFFHT